MNNKLRKQRADRGWSDSDAMNISDWFLAVIPEMLHYYKEHRNGSPGCLGEKHPNEDGIMVNETCQAEWDDILERLIALFTDANESTCTHTNPYESQYTAMLSEFEEMYGMLGEKLNPPGPKAAGRTQIHFPREVEEYRELSLNYEAEETKLSTYRDSCKTEAFALFSKWFWHLWD